MQRLPAALPPSFQELYEASQESIRKRLSDFAAVPREMWFYELCYCLCTPQSKARSAMMVQEQLQRMRFKEEGGAVEAVLADPQHYIRFHTTKATRLHALRASWLQIERLLDSGKPTPDIRTELAATVNGIGLKEAGHYLRNIGHTGVAILDRHVLRCLVACGVYSEIPSIATPKRYFEVEEHFLSFASTVHIPIDELDLLFWSMIAGDILK